MELYNSTERYKITILPNLSVSGTQIPLYDLGKRSTHLLWDGHLSSLSHKMAGSSMHNFLFSFNCKHLNSLPLNLGHWPSN